VSCNGYDSEGDSTPPASFTVTVTPQPTTPPTVTTFTPTYGPRDTPVTITGSNLLDASAVTIAGKPVQSFSVVSATAITAVAPAGSATGPISVTTPGGTVASTHKFVLLGPRPAMVVRSLEPSEGPVGTTVTIVGSNLTGVTEVTFAGTPATSYTDVSDTEVTATAPAGAATGTITLTSTSGHATSTSVFRVISPTSPPTITGFSPTTGFPHSTVIVRGSHLAGATAVLLGPLATTFAVLNDSTIRAFIPPTAATGPITVVTPGGTATSTSAFTVR
jgi:hypothetical protein